MDYDLHGKRIAFMTANEGVEQIELTSPWETVRAAGGESVLIAPKRGDVQAFQHLDKGDTFSATVATSDAHVGDYDGLVLPGGVANPDQLRMNAAAVELVQRFFDTGRPVAVICHGPWTIIEARRVGGRQITSWPSLRTDIRNAGGEWHDEEVVECHAGTNALVSSRRPDDLPAFNEKMQEVFAVERAFV
jgi:protease I